MKKRTWAISMCFIGTLIIGIVGGVTYSDHRFDQENVSRLDDSLAEFANLLVRSRNDMRQATPNPTTPEEKAYEVNYKVDVAQLYIVWGVMEPELISQGLPDKDVYLTGAGLNIIATNILPPRPTDKMSEQLAQEWITFLYDSMYPDDKTPQSNDVFLSRLKSRVTAIADKYRSYKSDGDFQVRSLPGGQ